MPAEHTVSPETLARIRASGRRVTIQRAQVIDAVRRLTGHQTAERVYAELRHDPTTAMMARSTVYRALDALTDCGLLRRYNDGSTLGYEWAPDQATSHHHLVCDRCGSTHEVALNTMRALADELRSQHGFAAPLQHMAIRGTCHTCASSTPSVPQDDERTDRAP